LELGVFAPLREVYIGFDNYFPLSTVGLSVEKLHIIAIVKIPFRLEQGLVGNT